MYPFITGVIIKLPVVIIIRRGNNSGLFDLSLFFLAAVVKKAYFHRLLAPESSFDVTGSHRELAGDPCGVIAGLTYFEEV